MGFMYGKGKAVIVTVSRIAFTRTIITDKNLFKKVEVHGYEQLNLFDFNFEEDE